MGFAALGIRIPQSLLSNNLGILPVICFWSFEYHIFGCSNPFNRISQSRAVATATSDMYAETDKP
jgi:hypothetical protein